MPTPAKIYLLMRLLDYRGDRAKTIDASQERVFNGRSEMRCEPLKTFRRKGLIPEKENKMPQPSIAQRLGGPMVEAPRKVKPTHFGPQRPGKGRDGDCVRTHG